MVNVKFHESEYEEVFIQCLAEEDWHYIPGSLMSNRLITDALYEPDLRNYLKSRYGDKNLIELDYDQIIANLRNTSETTNYLTARAVHKLVCHTGYDYQPLDGSAPFKVYYLDFDAEDVTTANIFRCINQFEMLEGEGVCLVEWGSRTAGLFPPGTLYVLIEKDLAKGTDYRRITITDKEEQG